MHALPLKLIYKSKCISLLTIFLCLTFLTSACQPTAKSRNVAESDKPTKTADANKGQKELAYGISIDTPQGWVVDGSVGAKEISNEQIKKRLAENKPAMLISMHRLDTQRANMLDARISLLLVDATKIIPQKDLSMPQAELDKRAETIIQMHAAQAKKEKRPNDVLSWSLATEQIGNLPALRQQGLVMGKDGEKILIMTWYIYLPENVAILVNTMGNPNVADMTDTLSKVVHSIKVK